ncbi:hypothetical protein HK098_005674 [Nowakowskiella sp. JEL0407]|nr:hypothetical protein HK098_005674 [Nowakowskiella sp. JEL0407]
MSFSTIIEKLSSLSLSPSQITHSAASNNKDWSAAVAKSNAPNNYLLTKSLLLKPKGGKDTPILVFAAESTEFAINAFVKKLGNKEARVANEDVLKNLLGVEKDGVSPFALSNVKDKSTISVIVDSSLFANNDTPLGFRLYSETTSIFVSASGVKSFLDNYGEYTVFDFSSLGAPAAAPASASTPKAEKKVEKKPVEAKVEKADDGGKEVKIGIEVKKNEDFPMWYQQVVKKSEMLEYYDVSGCYILRPWSYRIWKEIQKWFGTQIEELGVEDSYFPMFVSKRALELEKDHVEGFAPEVAWVTKAGSSDLEEPIAVRPTSETVMYPAYAKWIRSHRDLPLRLNQWNNVVRWEFKHPQPFLRTREFLWQEGHTAFATLEEASAEVLEILELYRRVYEELLAVPVIKGKKSEKEKFAGGLYTTTVEGFIPTTGRGIQGATSHCLGQNFAKMFGITFEDEDKETRQVWQNSWGITTRTIGVMVMVHGDDKGLILPPRVAAVQVVVIPVGITNKTTDAERKHIHDKVEETVAILKKAGLRVKSDLRHYTPGYKFNHWEMRGVPLRLEVGPADIAKNQVRAVRRDNGEKQQLSVTDLGSITEKLLQTIQSDMLVKAKKERDDHVIRLEKWDNFVSVLDKKNLCLVPWCEREKCEDEVKERSAKSAAEQAVDDKAPSMGAKTLCIPFEQPKENPLVPGVTKCFACGQDAKSYTFDEIIDLSGENPKILPMFQKPSNPASLVSKIANHGDFYTEWFNTTYKKLYGANEKIVYHRKRWELTYIANAVIELGLCKEGKKGLVWAAGKEILISFFAGLGCSILASDMPPDNAGNAAWAGTDQFASSKEALFMEQYVSKDKFNKLVSYRSQDMNHVPIDTRETYDFMWSTCSLEHIGTILLGQRFVLDAMTLLKPGGVAIHTTEFTLSSNSKTVDVGWTAMWRKKDVEFLAESLKRLGYEVYPLDFNAGTEPFDKVIDIPPYTLDPHFKLQLENHVTTSFAIIIKKPLDWSLSISRDQTICK